MQSHSDSSILVVSGTALVVLSIISLVIRLSAAAFLTFCYVAGRVGPIEWLRATLTNPVWGEGNLQTAFVAVIGLVFMSLWDCVSLWGGLNMQKLRSWRASVLGCIPVIVPLASPCFVLGLPFGWQALRILRQPGSRNHFQR